MRTFNPGFTCRPVPLVLWNQQDKSANIDLSGGLVTAIANATADGAVRATRVITSGKVYCELNGTVIGGGNTGMGLANASAMLSLIGATAAGAFVQFKSGNTYNNGSSVFSNGNMSGGGILRVAYDATAHLAWLAFGAGNWNANALNDPETGVGGQNVSALDSAGLFPMFCPSVSGDTCTANFGATSFTYGAPTGFSAWNA